MRIFTHPLRDGTTQILEKHFAPEIVKRFKMEFEANIFQGQNIKNQILNDKVAMEVYFDENGTANYICDVWSWMSPSQVEAHLLKMITDKARTGVIGKNWTSKDGKRISEDVTSGKYETPDKLIRKGMA